MSIIGDNKAETEKAYLAYPLYKYFSSKSDEYGCRRIHESADKRFESSNYSVFATREKINGCVVAKSLLVKLDYIRGKLFLRPFLSLPLFFFFLFFLNFSSRMLYKSRIYNVITCFRYCSISVLFGLWCNVFLCNMKIMIETNKCELLVIGYKWYLTFIIKDNWNLYRKFYIFYYVYNIND